MKMCRETEPPAIEIINPDSPVIGAARILHKLERGFSVFCRQRGSEEQRENHEGLTTQT